MLITVTNRDVLKKSPHLTPSRVEMTDTVALGAGKSASSYEVTRGDKGAGHGRLARCSACGTYLRAGQPHSALRPVPHQSLDMLTVTEPEDFEERAEEDAEFRLDARRRARGGR